MNKLKILAQISMLYISGLAALNAKDPSIDYAQEIIKTHFDHRFNYWEGGLEQPSGGMVLRMKSDVDGDGLDDWLYKTTIPSNGALEGWTVYLNKGNSTSKLTGFIVTGGPVYVEYEKNRTIFTSLYNRQDWLSVTRNYVNFDTSEITTKSEIYEGIENVSEAASRDYGKIIEVKDREVISLQALVYESAPWMSAASVGDYNQHHGLSKEEKEQMFPEVFTREMAKEYLASIESEPKEIKEEVSSSVVIEKTVSEEPKKEGHGKLLWIILGGVIVILSFFFIAFRGNSK